MMSTLLIGAALALAAPAPKDLPKTAGGKLEGTWVLTNAAEVKGMDVGPDVAVNFVFADGKVVIIDVGRKREKNEEAAYTVDATKKPAHIDIMPPAKAKAEVVKGIYEVAGDDLKLCFGKDGTDRPTEFKADKEKRIMLMVFKRQAEAKK